MMTLDQCKVGAQGEIIELVGSNPGVEEKLLAMGILPGRKVKLIKKFPSYIFDIGHSRFAVDADIASAIAIAITPS